MTRWLGCILIFALASAAGRRCMACDYTVRDIGFVRLGSPTYSVIVVGPTARTYEPADKELLSNWNINLLSVGQSSISTLPNSIQDVLSSDEYSSSIWLVDSTRRSLLLETAESPELLPSMAEVVDKHLATTRMREMGRGSLRSFAQIVLFDVDAQSRLSDAREAAQSLRDLEPMLPRPITLPAQVVVIPQSDRQAERTLVWAMGLDDLEESEPAMAVVYGRGRLAGPAMRGSEIELRTSIGQLALVGESCECETDRSWLDERTLPFFWTDENSRQAQLTLGFDPSNSQVQAEIQKVIERGSRNSRPQKAGDQIERIVSGYFESQVSGQQPQLLAIPPGKTLPSVSATVIAGDGWDFDDSVASTDSITQSSSETTSDHHTHRESDRDIQDPSLSSGAAKRINMKWLVVAAIGIVLAVAIATQLVRQRTGVGRTGN